ncbi:MAG: putative sporulation protein YtxC [Bacillota bacterium]|jgi:putative sporulation protein YtxC|nr:putative sporulation protein YtxC [Clostridia bacterium]
MATSISIGTSQSFELIRSQLDKEFDILHREGIDISLAETSIGNYRFLNCSMDRTVKPEQEMVLKHYVANAVADFILNYWENLILRKIIREHYYYLTNEEKENVVEKAGKILEASLRPGNNDYYMYRLNRKSKILHKVLDYLSLNSKINIDGFIKFRLQDYVDDLHHVLEQAVDELMLEKEYHEFIMLLKYFVDIQEPRAEKIHVLLLASGSFQLFDDNHRVVNNEFLEGCIVEMVDNEINYEDLLISALITIAPKEVVMHIPESCKAVNTVKTIEGVFGERAVLCYGCSLCGRQNQKNH